jgi:hypothetical protein
MDFTNMDREARPRPIARGVACRACAALGLLAPLACAAAELEAGGPPLSVLRMEGGAGIVLAEKSAALATGDVDGDRISELVLAPREGGLFIREPDGRMRPLLPGARVAGLAVADLSGDRRPELVFAGEAGRIFALDVGTRKIQPLPGLSARSLAAGDVDADGRDEVVAVLGDGTVAILEERELKPLDLHLPATAVAVWKFSRGEKVAIAVALASGDVAVVVPGGEVAMLPFTADVVACAAGDLDGDRVDELVVLDVEGRLFGLRDPFGREPTHGAWLGDIAFREPSPALAVVAWSGGGTGRFRRGDPNDSGEVDISDAVFTLGCLFLGNACPGCLDAADSNDDGAVDVSDAVYLLQWLFLGGKEPPAPGAGSCGPDGSPDELAACEYVSC